MRTETPDVNIIFVLIAHKSVWYFYIHYGSVIFHTQNVDGCIFAREFILPANLVLYYHIIELEQSRSETERGRCSVMLTFAILQPGVAQYLG